MPDSMYHERQVALVLMMMHVLGFGGSALVVMAVTMRSVVWLRSFGLAGSLMFIAYGAALAVWPVVVTNVVTASIHLYQLRMLINVRGGTRVGSGRRFVYRAVGRFSSSRA